MDGDRPARVVSRCRPRLCQAWRSGSSGRRTWEPAGGPATVLAWAIRPGSYRRAADDGGSMWAMVRLIQSAGGGGARRSRRRRQWHGVARPLRSRGAVVRGACRPAQPPGHVGLRAVWSMRGSAVVSSVNPVAVFEGGLHRRGERHGVAGCPPSSRRASRLSLAGRAGRRSSKGFPVAAG